MGIYRVKSDMESEEPKLNGQYLYWYLDKNDPDGRIGSWRTSSGPTDAGCSADPRSPSLGSGNFYPAYLIPSDLKYKPPPTPKRGTGMGAWDRGFVMAMTLPSGR